MESGVVMNHNETWVAWLCSRAASSKICREI